MIQSDNIINKSIITSIINTASSSTSICRIFQSAQNLVYTTIFTLIDTLITYTTLRTNHLKSNKNTVTMAKYPPKHLDSQLYQRTSIRRHVKMKRPKNLKQQLYRKTEETEVNTIMEKLDESDGNKNHRKNNIYHFVPL